MAEKKRKTQAEKTAAAVKAKNKNHKEANNTKKTGEEKQPDKKGKTACTVGILCCIPGACCAVCNHFVFQ